MKSPLVLPKALAGIGDALTKAIREVEIPGEWPGESLHQALQPEAIGNALVAAVHPDLKAASIAYLFKETMKRRDRLGLGKASKAAGALQFLTGFDFVLTFNWTAWKQLTAPQRIALVDHELCHCMRGEKGWEMLAHDVEEFRIIVQRWGLWTPDLVQLHAAIKAAQYDLWKDGALVTGIEA